ncbi:helix-turn-helix domain-containing protein [Planctomyces sp. SH-PL62]|uniref:helix-turn-helix domain-containing protein n=1 Tax=Planctomyces sp. SH-PL62 TaxID=1636152 RepID=UPI00078D949A|nr:helix-turn-helix domain-containing protein [Planctomyces sp. SH-PL62]AMV38809.1 hypothetical protein VT85_15345 [Planctomyces sp. SH-PL62]
MAQFYTLEEAARVLGMSPEELKAKAQQREVRAFLDGGTWRFRVVDIDELARRHGLGSDAELRLSDLEVPTPSAGDLDELDLSEFQLGVAKADLGSETMQFGSTGQDDEAVSDHDLMIDDLSVPPNPVTGSSSVIIGMSSSGKLPTDSDVRLVPDNVKGASDSDVRLGSPIYRGPSDSDVTLIKDDTSEHGLFAASSASDSGMRPGPMIGSSAEVPAVGSSDSDFELNPSSELVDALQPESGSDFELSALDASDEFEATPLKPSDSDVTAADPNLSGINLSRPSDSGINLLGSFNSGGGGESIELAPLSDEDLPTNRPRPAAAAPAKPKASLSATPPPAVGKGEKDIFDDTDFEVDAALDDESDDKTVQLNAGSDFDLEDSDSASEVFAIDEEDVDINAATAMAPASFSDDDDDEDDGFDDAVSSEMATAWASDDSPSSSASAPGVVISREPAADWDGLSVGLLAVASVFILLSSFLAYDLVRNLYDFNEGGPASGLVKSISGLVFQ